MSSFMRNTTLTASVMASAIASLLAPAGCTTPDSDDTDQVNSEPLPPIDPVARWGANQASVIQGDFAGLHGTAPAGVPLPTLASSGLVGYGMAFDGTQALQVDHAQLDTTTAFTVSAWFKTTAGGVVFANGEYLGYIVQVSSSGTVSCKAIGRKLIGRKVSVVYTTRTFSDGKWHHVACTFDGQETRSGGHVRIYMDGEFEAEDADPHRVKSINFRSVDPPVIGASNRAGSHHDFFVGEMDEVAVYDEALTPNEIRRLASIRPLARWSGNDAMNVATDDVGDSSGDGEAPKAPRAAVAAVVGRGTKFDGEQFISIDDKALNMADAFSVATWFKTASNGMLVSNMNGQGGRNGYHLWIGHGGRLFCDL